VKPKKQKVKLTKANIRTLAVPDGKEEEVYWDSEIRGFGLRVRESNSRTLVFQYFRQGPGNKTPKIKIGEVGAIEIDEARAIAKKYHARVQLGEDPARDKATAKRTASETFGVILPRFLARQRIQLRARSYPDVERHLSKHSKALHELQLAKIERRDIATVLSVVAENSGPPTSNRVRTSLSTFFAWAMGEGLVDNNPVSGTNRHEERSRDRVLAPAELRLIWNALDNDHYSAIIRLLLLTGQRAGEIAGLRWQEVDFDKRIISLSADRTKNHRAHTIPLSGPALAILTAYAKEPPVAATDGRVRDFVFGHGQGPFSGWSNCKDRLDAKIKAQCGKALPHWTQHDLRRSFATHAAELGICPPHIVETILNHISGHRAGVAGTYNKAIYAAETRVALDRWAEQLLAWVAGLESNVVALPRPA
jgi:integrase